MEALSVEEILADPAGFEGRPVEVAGRLTLWPEHCGVASFEDGGEALHLDFADSTVAASLASWRPAFWVPIRIRGTYHHGPSGHLGRYPGRLARITHMEAIDA